MTTDLVDTFAGQCRIQVDSTTQISLQRYQGKYVNLIVAGVLEARAIPASGPTISNAGLVASTLYYVYAFDNAGTLTLEASTTSHVTDATTGVEVKSGDNTRALVGVALTGAGSPGTFQPIGAGTLSWFNGSPEGTVGNPVGALTVPAYGPVWKLAPLDQSGWSWVNQGSATVAQGSGVVFLQTPANGTSNVRGRVVTAPSTPYTITARVIPNLAVGNSVFGIGFRESGTGKLVMMKLRAPSGDPRPLMSARKYTNPTTFSSQVETAQFVTFEAPFLRIAADGTNITLSYSLDGVNFTVLLTEAKGTFFTTAPDQVGIFVESFSDVLGMSVLSWLVS